MPNGTKVVEMKTRVGVAGEQTYREALKNISRELRVLAPRHISAGAAFPVGVVTLKVAVHQPNCLGWVRHLRLIYRRVCIFVVSHTHLVLLVGA